MITAIAIIISIAIGILGSKICFSDKEEAYFIGFLLGILAEFLLTISSLIE